MTDTPSINPAPGRVQYSLAAGTRDETLLALLARAEAHENGQPVPPLTPVEADQVELYRWRMRNGLSYERLAPIMNVHWHTWRRWELGQSHMGRKASRIRHIMHEYEAARVNPPGAAPLQPPEEMQQTALAARISPDATMERLRTWMAANGLPVTLAASILGEPVSNLYRWLSRRDVPRAPACYRLNEALDGVTQETVQDRIPAARNALGAVHPQQPAALGAGILAAIRLSPSHTGVDSDIVSVIEVLAEQLADHPDCTWADPDCREIAQAIEALCQGLQRVWAKGARTSCAAALALHNGTEKED